MVIDSSKLCSCTKSLFYFIQAFEVDENAPEYRALHPNKQKSKSSLVAEHFDLVSDGAEERSAESGDDSDAGSSSSEEEERVSLKNKRKRVSETPDVYGRKRKGSQPRLSSNLFS